MKSSLCTDMSHRNEERISIQKPEEIMNYEKSIVSFSTSSCEGKNPDHNYILEILSASGILRDLDHSLTHLQIHPSGHLIDPKLFFLLEENKTSPQDSSGGHNTRKVQRRLIFDAVNELLFCKLVLDGSLKRWSSSNNKATMKYRSERLFRDLCSEIDQLQNTWSSVNEDEDVLRSIQWQDLKKEPVSWTDHEQEMSGLVLDVERLIFKDLITEIVSREGDDLQSRNGRLCRQLF